MNELIELIKQVGIPWAIILAAGVVVYRLTKNTVWPFFSKIITTMVEHWKEQITEMNNARKLSFEQLTQYIKTESEKNNKVLQGLTMLTEEIKEMREEAKSRQ